MKKLALLLIPATLTITACEKASEESKPAPQEETSEIIDEAIAETEKIIEELAKKPAEKKPTKSPEEKTMTEITELKIETLSSAEGDIAKKGDTLQMHYTGTLLDGSKFDSSVDRGQPFQFTLGVGQVIKGWDEGIVGMKVGEKRKLTIPYQMAYGDRGFPPVIPPKSPLVFEIELIKIVK